MSAKEKDAGAAPAKKSKARLFIIIGVVLVLLLGGGAAMMMMSKSKAGAHGEEAKKEEAHELVFVPLDSFTVNLAGNQERFAQIMISLSISDPKAQEMVKSRAPLIKDRVLKIIAKKTAENLLSPAGKEKLAKEILESVKESLPAEARKSVKEALFTNFIVQ